ncbi:hypothetical protein QBC32DRAFT_374703 [Pseudoneurospora amorphoporcata]|uniref:Uncharacterized protein n=1 Tax=Pseudoneurospora amorphoporcata TaxID=241081 RepID=A0AAN6NJ77_9PEZI|nr:hypothetical protein QBC32DRAFT_374703 [Pseudoneurospora amorphoporcata]
MGRVKYVKERIGQEITDWSQLTHRRQRHEERYRVKELERQQELERRREAGEIPQADPIPANTPATIPTGAPARPASRAAPRATTAPITRRITRATARAVSTASTPDTTTTTMITDTARFVTPASAPAIAPGSAPAPVLPAVLPTVINMTVEEEEHDDMGLLDPALFEPFINEIVPQQVPAPMTAEKNQKAVEPVTRQPSARISQPANFQAASIPANSQTMATATGAPAYGSPLKHDRVTGQAYAPANLPANLAVVYTTAKVPAYVQVYAPVTTPASALVTASAFPPATAPAYDSTYTPAYAPAYAPSSAPGSIASSAPVTASASTAVTTPVSAPVTTLVTGRATETEGVEEAVPKVSEPVTGGNVPERASVRSAAQESQKITKPTAGQPGALDRMFAVGLEWLQSPTPEMISAEARAFVARAHENETEQAVKKAALTLSNDIVDRINELHRQNPADRIGLASEVLKLKLQQVFLKELVN